MVFGQASLTNIHADHVWPVSPFWTTLCKMSPVFRTNEPSLTSVNSQMGQQYSIFLHIINIQFCSVKSCMWTFYPCLGNIVWWSQSMLWILFVEHSDYQYAWHFHPICSNINETHSFSPDWAPAFLLNGFLWCCHTD